jgi:hypothetical protein
VVSSPLWAVPLPWQRNPSSEKLILAQHSCSQLKFSKCHHFCRLSPNASREIMATQVCHFDAWTKSAHLSKVLQKSLIGHLIVFSLLIWCNGGS